MVLGWLCESCEFEEDVIRGFLFFCLYLGGYVFFLVFDIEYVFRYLLYGINFIIGYRRLER